MPHIATSLLKQSAIKPEYLNTRRGAKANKAKAVIKSVCVGFAFSLLYSMQRANTYVSKVTMNKNNAPGGCSERKKAYDMAVRKADETIDVYRLPWHSDTTTIYNNTIAGRITKNLNEFKIINIIY